MRKVESVRSRYRYQIRCSKNSSISLLPHIRDIASAISVKGYTPTRKADSFRSFIK